MTDRENAIEWFTMLKEKFVNTVYGEYLEMAIKALEKEPFDEIIDKAVKEIFVQCKQTNPNYSKDWNEGFNDGMFHTMTIIKGIRKGEIQ